MVSMAGKTAELIGGAHGRHPAHRRRGERCRRHAFQTAPLGGCQCKRAAQVFGGRLAGRQARILFTIHGPATAQCRRRIWITPPSPPIRGRARPCCRPLNPPLTSYKLSRQWGSACGVCVNRRSPPLDSCAR
jgi:hypothetical protein